MLKPLKEVIAGLKSFQDLTGINSWYEAMLAVRDGAVDPTDGDTFVVECAKHADAAQRCVSPHEPPDHDTWSGLAEIYLDDLHTQQRDNSIERIDAGQLVKMATAADRNEVFAQLAESARLAGMIESREAWDAVCDKQARRLAAGKN